MRLSPSSVSSPLLNGRGRRFAVVVARFNSVITDSMRDACVRTLESHGGAVRVIAVPGAFELPLVARRLARSKKYDAVIALGCIIRGETPHDRYIAMEVARGLGQAALETDVPILFGVLTPLNARQARARAGKGPNNKGAEAALAALEMANLREKATPHHPHPARWATVPQEGKENRDFPSPLGRGQGEGLEQLREKI